MKHSLVAILLSLLAACYSKEPEKTELAGQLIPTFKLFLEDSVTYFNTQDILPGKPVVLLYFGPHCPYSRAQVEEITKNMDKLKGIDFYLLTTWSFSELKTFCSDYRLQRYSNIIAGVDYTNFFVSHFGVTGVPYMAIYGRDKRLREVYLGNVMSSQIKSVAQK